MPEKTDARLRELPFWQRPGWLTAMAGVVTALITIPAEVGKYFHQEAETETVMAKNEGLRQTGLLELVETALEVNQPPERLFLVRYLSYAHDDERVRNWARNEIVKLETVVATGQKAQQLTSQVAQLTAEKALMEEEKSTNAAQKAAYQKTQAELEMAKVELAEAQSRLQAERELAALATPAPQAMPSSELVDFEITLKFASEELQETPLEAREVTVHYLDALEFKPGTKILSMQCAFETGQTCLAKGRNMPLLESFWVEGLEDNEIFDASMMVTGIRYAGRKVLLSGGTKNLLEFVCSPEQSDRYRAIRYFVTHRCDLRPKGTGSISAAPG